MYFPLETLALENPHLSYFDWHSAKSSGSLEQIARRTDRYYRALVASDVCPCDVNPRSAKIFLVAAVEDIGKSVMRQ